MATKSANLIPFEVTLPAKKLHTIDTLSEEELDIELEKGYQNMLHGQMRPAEQVFSDIHKDYGI